VVRIRSRINHLPRQSSPWKPTRKCEVPRELSNSARNLIGHPGGASIPSTTARSGGRSLITALCFGSLGPAAGRWNSHPTTVLIPKCHKRSGRNGLHRGPFAQIRRLAMGQWIGLVAGARAFQLRLAPVADRASPVTTSSRPVSPRQPPFQSSVSYRTAGQSKGGMARRFQNARPCQCSSAPQAYS
jgi:hypothetical protein